MLTLEDCIALSDLTKEEIDAIADHECLPEVLAAELGCYLVHTVKGVPMIRRMIHDDIAAARTRGDLAQVARLKLALRHFVETHAHNRPAD